MSGFPSRACEIEKSFHSEVVPFDEGLAPVGVLDPDRCEHELVETFRGREIRDADRDVVEHA